MNITGSVYQMKPKKQNSFNGQVFQKSYKRLNLSPSERHIFQKLLGFLIRNSKSFPYSAVSLAKVTGFSLSTVFRVLDRLEYLRLIERVGMGKNRRFSIGSILSKILTTVSNRNKIDLLNNLTTVSPCDKNLPNRVMVTYRKTSSSLKRKDKEVFFDPGYQEYVGRIKSDIDLGILNNKTKILTYEEWLLNLN